MDDHPLYPVIRITYGDRRHTITRSGDAWYLSLCPPNTFQKPVEELVCWLLDIAKNAARGIR